MSAWTRSLARRHALVAVGQLTAGEFGLALVRNSEATPMNDAGRLDDYHVVDDDVLHLVNKAPQVDG